MTKRFPPHLNTTLWNLQCSSGTCYHWVVTEINSRIYRTSTVASKFARFESESPEFCKRYYKKTFWSLFLGRIVHTYRHILDNCCKAWQPQTIYMDKKY